MNNARPALLRLTLWTTVFAFCMNATTLLAQAAPNGPSMDETVGWLRDNAGSGSGFHVHLAGGSPGGSTGADVSWQLSFDRQCNYVFSVTEHDSGGRRIQPQPFYAVAFDDLWKGNKTEAGERTQLTGRITSAADAGTIRIITASTVSRMGSPSEEVALVRAELFPFFDDSDMAQRVVKALQRLVVLCGGKAAKPSAF